MQGNQIVARIKYLAAVRGVPMETLYADCKISSSAVSQWKNGVTKPSFDSIRKIATYLETTSEYLLFGDGNDSENSQNDLPRSGLRIRPNTPPVNDNPALSLRLPDNKKKPRPQRGRGRS